MSRSALFVIILALIAIIVYLLYRGGYLGQRTTSIPTSIVPKITISPTEAPTTITLTPTLTSSPTVKITPTPTGY